jgi:glycosyltransferase involved in cell wall biosynthesis
MGTAVVGIPDCVPSGAGLLVPGASSAAEVAEAIEPLIVDPDLYGAMRTAARRLRSRYTWSRAVERFRQIWGCGKMPDVER